MSLPPRSPRLIRASCIVVLLLVAAASSARAQVVDQPPGPFVIDARGAFSTVGRSEALALPRGLQAAELPRRVLGLDVGAHVYPVRGRVTVGVGGALVRLSGTQTPEPLDVGAPADAPVTPGTFSLTSLAPQVSLNFGTARGWSYVGAGVGLSRLKVGRAESATLESSPQLPTLHVGGGARWFFAEHAAFGFDLRFYRVGASDVSGAYLGNPTVSLFVMSAGLSFK